ncbi:MAG TPA: hypothetical protein VFP47_20465 [Pyrinomonadaceae bacterium]|nr:hypothetical protein [Pyrinomonadaceae bacterium]
MTITVRKTNLNEMNHGKCGTRNNSRYSGKTVVYELVQDGEGMEIGFKTKKEAEAVAGWANVSWDGKGDVVTKYHQSLTRIETMLEKVFGATAN